MNPVSFANPIRPQQKGYIYIWVSNESENTKVWFDDLKVTHRSRRVTQATVYYAYGSVLREQKTPEELTYRYKYQGQYAEKDEETGWSHFELREFDPVVGRWTAKDPKGQYYSPYVGMGNNPISGLDPDGGFKTQLAARWFALWNGGGDIERSLGGSNKGEWYVGKSMKYTGEGAGVAYKRTFDGEGLTSRAWNSPPARMIIPDYYVFNINVQAGFGGYLGKDVAFTLMLRGKDPGLYSNETTNFGIMTSGGVDAGLGIGNGWFLTLNPRNASSDIFDGPQVSGAIGAELKAGYGGGANISGDVGYSDKGVNTLTLKLNGTVGYGIASPVHGEVGGGITNYTKPIFKF